MASRHGACCSLTIHSSDDATRRPMFYKEIVTQPVLQASPSSYPEAYAAPFLLPVCCVCGLIRDETGSLPIRMSWVTPESYRRTHDVRSTNLLLTHTYCPDCLLQAQIRMREFFREQKEQIIESLRKSAPAEKARKEPRRQNCEAPPLEGSENHRSLHTVQ